MVARRQFLIFLGLLAILLTAGGFLLAGGAGAPGETPGDGMGPGEVLDLEADGPNQLTPGLYVLDSETREVWRVLDQKGFDIGGGPTYAWSSDSRWLVASSIGNFDKIVAVSRDGRERREATGQAWSVSNLDDGGFALHMRPGTIDEDRAEVLARLELPSMATRALAPGADPGFVSPDGRYALRLGDDRALVVRDLASGEERALVSSGTVGLVQQGSVWSPDSHRVVFTDYESDNTMLVAEAGGDSEPVAIATDVTGAAWSPDGKSLAYVVVAYEDEQGPAKFSIETRAADASRPARQIGEGNEPAWSPDGRQLAFVREGAVWRVELAGGKAERSVGAPLPQLAEPRWSPDGRYLAFRARDGGGEILAIDADGGNERFVGVGTEAKWSPDGKRLAFIYGAGFLGFSGGIATMNADGSGILTLGRVLYSDALPPCLGDEYEWSPDGRWIAYWTDDEGSLFVAPADGSGQALRLGEGLAPTWSPDSQRVMYAASGRGFLCGIYTLPKAGGTPQLVMEGASAPEWSPDGALVVARGDPRARTFNLILFRADDPAVRRDLGAGAGPVWSPDSSHVAYYRSQGGAGPGILPPELSSQGTVVVQAVEPADSTVIEIPVQGSVGDYAWSPDGRRVAVTIANQQDVAIYVVDLVDPTHLRRLTEGHSPSWSPDGKTIVFSRYYGN
jgi:Tol biopolymer transport system component